MPIPKDFDFDVFLSHSTKDKAVVLDIAKLLRADGLRVWFDAWQIKPGDHIPSKIEYGLEHSRVLVLCMSANAFASEWAQLEAGTFRFRDPLNVERRFIPLRLDQAPVKGALAQFLYIDWNSDASEQAYTRLREACQPPAQTKSGRTRSRAPNDQQKKIRKSSVLACAFNSDGTRALTGGGDKIVKLWDVETRRSLGSFAGHTDYIWCIEWSADSRHAVSASADKTVRLWDVHEKRCLRVFQGHTGSVNSVAWSADQRHLVSGGTDATIRLWDVETGECSRAFSGPETSIIGPQQGGVYGLAMSVDGARILSGWRDGTVRLWDVETGKCVRVFEGHTGELRTVAWSSDQRHALSGAGDGTVRLWNVETGNCVRVLEGHAEMVWTVAWSANQRHALSGSHDARLWDLETGECVKVIAGRAGLVRRVAWRASEALLADSRGSIWVSDLQSFFGESTPKTSPTTLPAAAYQVQYTNAKVLLVGESGAGKTGLSKVLAGEEWQPSDSTVGAWATQWKLPLGSVDGVEREIWLWDFGGQADQRLIHQLYMDETALAALVFDGQKEDLYETLGQWDRDLTRASSNEFSKLLVAGRVDAGGLRVSRAQLEIFAREHGFSGILETSAKVGTGCEELKQAIVNGIKWEEIPWRSSPLLFRRLKEEIIRLKDAGRVLMRFNELRETLQMRLSGGTRFTDDELKAVVGLLAGPGVVWILKFGSWVLLQPERINAYAQAVIQTMREDEYERGCIAEERVLNGDLTYHSSVGRLEANEERFVLLAMHQMLLERGLCLREHTERGPLLIFPSYYRRERPELVGHPAVLASYRFNGFIDDIYATLVVRLHHTKPFEQDQLWRYAADFKTLTKKQLGLKLTRRAQGSGELQVYFNPSISMEEKIIFSKYIHEHLLQYARDVVRLRHYACPHCFTGVGNREVAMTRLDEWLNKGAAEVGAGGRSNGRDAPTIVCVQCEKRVPLWDEIEQCFANPEATGAKFAR
jgi:small GTP-binding protein